MVATPSSQVFTDLYDAVGRVSEIQYPTATGVVAQFSDASNNSGWDANGRLLRPGSWSLEISILTITNLDINGDNDYDESMAVLNIRNLPDSVHQALRLRAAKAGRSMEAEVRAILTEMFSPAAPPLQEFQEWVDHLYGDNKPNDVVGKLLNERRLEVESEP